jgi:hypothetical protein
MSRFTVVAVGVALLTGLTLGCDSSAPLAPSVANPGGPSSNPDGSTLKVTAPTPLSPVGDQKLTSTDVTLSASGATGTYGAAGTLQYRFQVLDPGNTTVQDSGLMASPNFPVTAKLQANTRYTWRVRAESQGGVGPWSTSGSFVTQTPAPPFDMRQAIILDNPADVASWAETAAITYADTSGDYVIVDHSKRTGSGRWPESGFGTGGIQYTLGMCFNLSNQWYCSAAIQFWDGRDLDAGGSTREIGINWYYDARWGPMAGHQPNGGETIGIWVAQGNLRDSGNTSLKERSNVVLMPYGSLYTIDGGVSSLKASTSTASRKILSAPR